MCLREWNRANILHRRDVHRLQFFIFIFAIGCLFPAPNVKWLDVNKLMAKPAPLHFLIIIIIIFRPLGIYFLSSRERIQFFIHL